VAPTAKPAPSKKIALGPLAPLCFCILFVLVKPLAREDSVLTCGVAQYDFRLEAMDEEAMDVPKEEADEEAFDEALDCSKKAKKRISLLRRGNKRINLLYV
jgi:hypothetical protein